MATLALVGAVCLLVGVAKGRSVPVNYNYEPWCETPGVRAWEVAVYYVTPVQRAPPPNFCVRHPVRYHEGAVIASEFGVSVRMACEQCSALYTTVYAYAVGRRAVFKIAGYRPCADGMATDVAGLHAFGNCSRINLTVSCASTDISAAAQTVEQHSGIFSLARVRPDCTLGSSYSVHKLCNRCRDSLARLALGYLTQLARGLWRACVAVWRSGAVVSMVAGLWLLFFYGNAW